MTEIDYDDFEIKPTSFARGVPKERHNGFFGIEEKLVDEEVGTQFTAVVTFRLDDVISKRGAGVQYPVIAIDHIEPVWDEGQLKAAKAVQIAEYQRRTGKDTLDFDVEEESE
jgi:protein-disulfide isomerase-like protein with CxxC motif